MSELTFDSATMMDLKTIVAIYNESVAKQTITADLKKQTVRDKKAWFIAHHTLRPLYIVKEQNQVIGWFSFSDFYGRPAYQHTAEISIYLTETKCGCTYGSQILMFAEKKAKSLYIQTILAYIFHTNQASLSLFKKHHYQEYGCLPQVAQLQDEKLDVIILGKKI